MTLGKLARVTTLMCASKGKYGTLVDNAWCFAPSWRKNTLTLCAASWPSAFTGSGDKMMLTWH